MKSFCRYVAGLLLLFAVVSCSKTKEKSKGCPPVPLAASLLAIQAIKFQMVDKTSGKDLFFAPNAPYALTDIKIVFRNSSNKLDSVSPPMKEEWPTGWHFVYPVTYARTLDTCYIKIKGLKTDTLISTLSVNKGECGTSYALSKVQVNKNTPFAYSFNSITIIKK